MEMGIRTGFLRELARSLDEKPQCRNVGHNLLVLVVIARKWQRRSFPAAAGKVAGIG